MCDVNRWHKKTSSGQMVSVNNNSRIVITTSALIIKDCQISDGGNYVCEISNEVGKEFVDVSVTIQGMCPFCTLIYFSYF